MKREDVIRLAESAGWSFGWEMTAEAMIEFAAMIEAETRERCAELCVSYSLGGTVSGGIHQRNIDCAEAIRALGDD